MPLLLDQLGPCPVCGAAVAVTGPLYRQHLDWHTATGTYLAHGYAPTAGDDAPTAKLPPIGETVRRRPPVPAPSVVRELRGAELLRALADEIEHELQEEEQQARFWGDNEDQDDDAGERRP